MDRYEFIDSAGGRCPAANSPAKGKKAKRQTQREKALGFSARLYCRMVVVLCNDAEIEVNDGEVCQICGCELEEFDEVTGTGIHGYYHWTCVNHVD